MHPLVRRRQHRHQQKQKWVRLLPQCMEMDEIGWSLFLEDWEELPEDHRRVCFDQWKTTRVADSLPRPLLFELLPTQDPIRFMIVGFHDELYVLGDEADRDPTQFADPLRHLGQVFTLAMTMRGETPAKDVRDYVTDLLLCFFNVDSKDRFDQVLEIMFGDHYDQPLQSQMMRSFHHWPLP